MKLLTERAQIKAFPRKWMRFYGLGTYGADRRGRQVGAELMALNTYTATVEDINEITGGTENIYQRFCDECGKRSWDIVELGEELDHDSNTALICADCLKAALSLLDGKT